MASTHSKLTTITLMCTSPAVTGNISAWVDNSQFSPGADQHDITGYGSNGHVLVGGLTNGTFTCGGWYDTTASTGTSAIMTGLNGATVLIIRRVRGAGSGFPHQYFNAVGGTYTESSPVADVVRWTMDFAISGDVTNTTQ